MVSICVLIYLSIYYPPWQWRLCFCALVYLFICLSVCEKHYSKRYERIGMKFVEGSWVVQRRTD